MDASILSTSEQGRRLVERATEVLRVEAGAISALADRIDENFVRACGLILACTGRVVVSGIGKSGHIANKIAATLASTGTPAFFVHPAEASHGDLGMITRDDVLIALSNSGATSELLAIVPLLKRRGAKLIAMTGDPNSALAALADVHLNSAVAREACPLNLAPTASTTAALALGDALAVALLDARGFGPDDFASSHPGGALGRRLLTHVGDVMRTGEALPTVTEDAPMAVTETGILTDGDLRRLLEREGDIRDLPVGQVMTRSPAGIAPTALAAEAAKMMEDRRISQLLVLDERGQLVGALHIHDLL
ncbi:MAG: KpsF/GutQ family sugar-phosphate isomerase, partial [Quisquiliibacterium sp.]